MAMGAAARVRVDREVKGRSDEVGDIFILEIGEVKDLAEQEVGVNGDEMLLYTYDSGWSQVLLCQLRALSLSLSLSLSPGCLKRNAKILLTDATCAGGTWDESRAQSTAGRCRLSSSPAMKR